METVPREEELWTRPDPADIHDTWKEIFSDPLLSLGNLKAKALSKEGLGPNSQDGGISLRSVYWRFYHGLLPTPTSLDLFPPHLESLRSSYTTLRRRFLVAPDGRWAADCTGEDDQPVAGPSKPPTPTPSAEGWDPLSLDGQSPWKTWFAHQELRATIRQDVERTFPDIPYFRLDSVRRAMTTSLFLFSVLNPDVGYRQGMHELLAVCYLTVDRDSLENKTWNGSITQARPMSPSLSKVDLETAMRYTLDRRYVEHDSFALFQEIMRSGKAFYEWRAEEGPRSKSPVAPQAPIITRCNHLQQAIIGRIDPQLWERMENEGVEAQIWAIRWLRLIFTRELPFGIALRLWDGIFAEDPGLGILDFVCMALLLLIRNELVMADYPRLLTNLLHYPSPSATYPFIPHLILSQALFLRNNISPSAGVEVVLQNQDLLGISAAPPVHPQESPISPIFANSRGGGNRGSNRGSLRGRGGRNATTAPVGGMQSLAQGLFERAHAAGLDKAVLSTIADLRKNLPEGYFPSLPFSPAGSPSPRDTAQFSSIPNTASVLPVTRSFWSSSYSPDIATSSNLPSATQIPAQQQHPQQQRPDLNSRASVDSNLSVKSLKDAERDMAELRLAMLGMGKAMSEWLDVLHPLNDRGGNTIDTQTTEKEEAWRGLTKVRDTLLDAAGKDVDEIVKEWGWHDGLEAPRSSRGTTPDPTGSGTFGEESTRLTYPVDKTPTQPSFPDDVKVSLPTSSSAPPSTTTSSKEEKPAVPSTDELSPSPDIQSKFPPPTQQNNPRPPSLYLSSRNDTPMSGLSRVPLTSPLSSKRDSWGSRKASPTSTSHNLDRKPSIPIGKPLQLPGSGSASDSVNGDKPGTAENGDPLAGLGVSSSTDIWRRHSTSGGRVNGLGPLGG